jgi:hypothetical protein
MFHPSSQEILFGLQPRLVQNLGWYLLLNWGPLLLLGLAGILRHPPDFPVRILSFYLAVCFFLILFVQLDLPGLSDISLKLGHFANVVLLLLAAGFLDRMLLSSAKRMLWIPAVVLLLLPSGMTWVMDAYNSSDVQNHRFTTYVSGSDQEILTWMRDHLPGGSTVLQCSQDYEEFVFDVIPPLAERSVFLGNRIFSRIFQVSAEEINQRKAVVTSILKSGSDQQVWKVASEAGIDYFYFGSREAVRFADLRGLLKRPYFSLVMQEGESYLFRLENSNATRP